MLKFKKDGYARHDSGTVYKVKDISPNPYNPQVLLVSLVTGKRTYTRAIQTDKLWATSLPNMGQATAGTEVFLLSLFR